MINFYPAFIDRDYARRNARKEKGIQPPPASEIVDHIEHAVAVAGIDHVGLGSDFDGIPAVPRGMEDAGKLPFITYELLRRGHPESDIKKILGENILRVMAENESRRKGAAQ